MPPFTTPTALPTKWIGTDRQALGEIDLVEVGVQRAPRDRMHLHLAHQDHPLVQLGVAAGVHQADQVRAFEVRDLLSNSCGRHGDRRRRPLRTVEDAGHAPRGPQAADGTLALSRVARW